MSFFVSSMGNGDGDLGGVAGADQLCQDLATGAGAGALTWRAYLSTAAEHARDRIGTGPWFDAEGILVASNVAGLHAQGIVHERMLDQSGAPVPNGKTNPGMNEHDILTGSNQDGTFSGANCEDFTSSSSEATTTVGHCDASFSVGGGSSPVAPSDNWNSTHASTGCDAGSLFNTGSSGRIYCFAL
jgi:hypothetical protein